jgi:hypothetical protein
VSTGANGDLPSSTNIKYVAVLPVVSPRLAIASERGIDTGASHVEPTDASYRTQAPKSVPQAGALELAGKQKSRKLRRERRRSFPEPPPRSVGWAFGELST